jgi:hypothetical protein
VARLPVPADLLKPFIASLDGLLHLNALSDVQHRSTQAILLGACLIVVRAGHCHDICQAIADQNAGQIDGLLVGRVGVQEPLIVMHKTRSKDWDVATSIRFASHVKFPTFEAGKALHKQQHEIVDVFSGSFRC